MREEDKLGIILLIAIISISMIFALALIAGNVVNQLFAPVPDISGPLGAAASLIVFIILGGKMIELAANNL